MVPRLSPLALVFVLAALPACLDVTLPSRAPEVSDADTLGDLGRVDLTYQGPAGGDACDQGCGLGMPLMLGDDEGISIGPSVASPSAALPPLGFRSSDPTVFDVSPELADGAYPGARATALQGVAPGSAKLLLFDATTNALFDSTTVTVAPAASISISFQIQAPGARLVTTTDLMLGVGEQAAPTASVLDAGGKAVAGWNGVVLSIADETVASIDQGSSVVLVTALAKGQTTLRAQAGAAVTVIAVTVQ